MNVRRFSKLNDAYQRIMNAGFSEDISYLNSLNFSFIPVIGKPGVGKGTGLEELAKTHDINVITTGDIFRKPATYGMSPQLSQDINDVGYYFYVENKRLAPDDMTMRVIAHALKYMVTTDKLSKPYVCFADLFPRSTGQIGLTEEIGSLKEVWYFDASDVICVERMKQRDKEMNRPDKGQYQPRLNEYYEKTAPTLRLLEEYGFPVRTIDSSGDISSVKSQIIEHAKVLGLPKK